MYQIMVALLSGLEPTQFGLKLSEFGLLSLAGFTLSLYPSKSFLVWDNCLSNRLNCSARVSQFAGSTRVGHETGQESSDSLILKASFTSAWARSLRDT